MHDNSFSSWSRALVILAPVFTACGGGGGGVSSGVDGSRKGEDLSDDETVKVCQAIVDYGATAIDVGDACKIYGVVAGAAQYALQGSDATIQSSCNDATTKCKEDAEPSDDTAGTCDEAVTDPTCTATVSDVETCASERIDAARAGFDKLPSCSQLSRAYFDDPPKKEPDPKPSTACENTDKHCPTAAAVIAGSLTL